MIDRQKLTLLTRPLDDERWNDYGHRAVSRSLLTGFEKIGFSEFNFQPNSEQEIADHVHVLFGVGPCKTLQYAYSLKQKGIIQHITAGPNVVSFPFEQNGLIESDDLELYCLPSEWFRVMFALMSPQIEDKLRVWPAGVDSDLLEHKHVPKKKAIIYRKGAYTENFYASVRTIIEGAGCSDAVL